MPHKQCNKQHNVDEGCRHDDNVTDAVGVVEARNACFDVVKTLDWGKYVCV